MRRNANESHGQRSTAAGNLLKELTADGVVTLHALSVALEVPEPQLAECRDGKGRLAPRVQLRLAKLAPGMSSRLEAPARRLNAQARAALQYETDGADTRHASYPRAQFR